MLLCLVKGNTTANAFTVDIDSGKLVENPGDHLDDQLKNLTLHDSDKLSAINEIGVLGRETTQEAYSCLS
ncbi:unnamed protein product [Rhizophagus irregularis]|uniref:Uncharacterized protein n=1 Tax=Rhizophagus irregularis TaxID=588596 RepID=A0A2I1HBF2_9GLOM|nr:hypothetical protein RhiirA4_476322 [Rhizophagus irregularis]CAB4438012.1 unnamed protein product [Rhizophagus irregularis]